MQFLRNLAAWYNSKTNRQVNILRITVVLLSAIPIFGWVFIAPWLIPLTLFLEFHRQPETKEPPKPE